MPFSLRAEPLLGTYRGHRPDLSQERIPSVARLHSALLCAAGFGPRAVRIDSGWVPCDDDEAALRWLEDNPPTDVSIPRIAVRASQAIAYRDDGTIGKSGKAKTIRKLPKQDAAVAVDGSFVWTWQDPPPEPVARALRELCPDVPHLGTAESPVLMTADDEEIESTHRLDRDATPFSLSPGHDVDVPARGRIDELAEAHRRQRGGRVGSDRAGTDERALAPVPPRRAIVSLRYQSVVAPTEPVPWADVLLLPLDRRIPEWDRVRWAVAAHRRLISILDRDSPPVLTGVYPDGVRRPTNRVALHILDPDHPVDLPDRTDRSTLAVLLPSDIPPSDAEAVYRAVGLLQSIRASGRPGPRGLAPARTRITGRPVALYGERLWRPPAPGTVRLWRTDPAAVPDTRGYDGWTFTHAPLLSLGFVWQGIGIAAAAGRGRERDDAIVDAVNAAGVAVLRTDPIRHSAVENYVHKVHPHAVVRPYRAMLSLGDLCGSTTVQAIGQCRHLGGGLLVPEDHPEGAMLGGAPA